MGLNRQAFTHTIKWLMFAGFILINLVSCSKKKTASDVSVQSEQETAITNEFPLIAGRSLDSLKHQKYTERILAFSIELGHRSNDFNTRLAMMLRAGAGGNWREAIQKALETDNYKAAEKHNIDYLDSLRQLILHPDSDYREHFTALTGSYERLQNNYSLIRNYASFKNIPAILDTVLSNEIVIKGSLKSFEEFMRTIGNKKLPN